MASTYTPRNRWELIGNGETGNEASWDLTLNEQIGLIEDSVSGIAAITMTDADKTLSTANGGEDEARHAIIALSGGSLTTTRNVICPAVEKLYVVSNATSGGQSIVFKTASGTGITVPNGSKKLVYCDGTNVVDLLTDLPSGTRLNGTALTSVFQALSSNLTTIASLTPSAGNAIVGNGSAWLSEPLDVYNAIINGDFDIWQRGTSFASIADAAYFADRFVYGKIGAMVHDVSRSTDVPTVAQAGRLYNYSALVDCTTVDSSIAVGDLCVIQQRIEGSVFLPLAQRAFTLSFWVRGTKTGVYCVALRNAGSDRSYVAEYTINVSDAWEFKTVTVTASPSAGTWDYTTGIGLTLSWALAAGSNHHTTAGTWVTGGPYFATANQVNACDNTANNFRITGVRLVAGSVAKPLVQRPYAQELALCQRYYEKSFRATQAPATNTGSGGDTYYLSQPIGASVFFYGTPSVPFRVPKRTTPTVTLYNTAAANNEIRNYSRSSDCSSSTISTATETRFITSATSAGGSAVGDLLGFGWTASAEL